MIYDSGSIDPDAKLFYIDINKVVMDTSLRFDAGDIHLNNLEYKEVLLYLHSKNKDARFSINDYNLAISDKFDEVTSKSLVRKGYLVKGEDNNNEYYFLTPKADAYLDGNTEDKLEPHEDNLLKFFDENSVFVENININELELYESEEDY